MPAAAHADIDDSEYEIRVNRKTAAERARIDAEFRREQAREAAAAEQARVEEARRASELQARLAARPYPLRITEQRCTHCHAETHYTRQAHTWPGWLVVVMRMKVLNDAGEIAGEEILPIAGYLHETYGAEGSDALFEYALIALMPLLPGLIALLWARRRSRTRP